MNKIIYLFFIILFTTSLLSGAIVITTTGGATYTFGNWSPPKAFFVPSSEGKTQVIERRCEVIKRLSAKSETYIIEVAIISGKNEILVGEPVNNKLVCGNKIWAISENGRDLRIRKSEETIENHNGEEQSIQRYISKFLEDSKSEWWEEGSGQRIDLANVYGINTICTTSDGNSTREFDILDLSVDRGNLNILMKSQSGRKLSMTLSTDLTIVSASIDNKLVPVLFSISSKYPDCRIWYPPFYGEASTDNSGPPALIYCRNYYSQNTVESEMPLATTKAVVLLDSGSFWIGPADSSLEKVGNTIIGVMMDKNKQEINFYGSKEASIPLSQDSSANFNERLLKFEDELKTSQYHFKETLKISIARLFAGSGCFADDCSFYLRNVATKENQLIITLNSDNPQKYPEILLNTDLTIISSRILDWDSPEIRTRMPKKRFQ